VRRRRRRGGESKNQNLHQGVRKNNKTINITNTTNTNMYIIV